MLRSFSEIGYLAWGRISIFVINFIIFFAGFGLIMLYFIVFSGIAMSIMIQSLPDKVDMFYCKKPFWVLVIALLATPLIIKKEMKELRMASYGLFFAVFLFVVIFTIELGIEGPQLNGAKLYEIHIGLDFLTAISIYLVAYSF